MWWLGWLPCQYSPIRPWMSSTPLLVFGGKVE